MDNSGYTLTPSFLRFPVIHSRRKPVVASLSPVLAAGGQRSTVAMAANPDQVNYTQIIMYYIFHMHLSPSLSFSLPPSPSPSPSPPLSLSLSLSPSLSLPPSLSPSPSLPLALSPSLPLALSPSLCYTGTYDPVAPFRKSYLYNLQRKWI